MVMPRPIFHLLPKPRNIARLSSARATAPSAVANGPTLANMRPNFTAPSFSLVASDLSGVLSSSGCRPGG